MESVIPEAPYSSSPVERRLRAAESEEAFASPSLLQELLASLEEDGKWWVSFSDLGGLAELLPDLRLPVVYQLHRCEFCAFAKRDIIGLSDCSKNKRAVNRLAVRSGKEFSGICHLGVTDVVQPLVLGDRVEGVFFAGSVVLRETEGAAKKRIVRYVKRRGGDLDEFLVQWNQLARVDATEVERVRSRLRLIARVTSRLAEPATGLSMFRGGRGGLAGVIWEKGRHAVPEKLRLAMKIVQEEFHRPLNVTDLASRLGIRPDYLGSLFRKHTNGTLGDHLNAIRIRHARALLQTGKFSAGEVALTVGYADQSQFTKAFKAETGMTPGSFAKASLV